MRAVYLVALGRAVERFDPAQPRVGKGHGRLSGRWIDEAIADLMESFLSGEVDREELSGGEMGTTSLVEHQDGRLSVHKVLGDVSHTFGPLFPPEQQADAEQLAALLGRSIGAPVPAVLRTAPDEVYMEHVRGQPGASVWKQLEEMALTQHDRDTVDARARRRVGEIADTPEGFRLGLFDILIGNWDRAKADNWLVSPTGTPVGVDHSFAFVDVVAPTDPPRIDGLGPFALHFVGIKRDESTYWEANPLTPGDIQWLRERLAAVEDDFTEQGRHDWWEFASTRLDVLAAHATGTESRLAA